MGKLGKPLKLTPSDLSMIYRLDSLRKYKDYSSIKIPERDSLYFFNLITGVIGEMPQHTTAGKRVLFSGIEDEKNFIYVTGKNREEAEEKAARVHNQILSRIKVIREQPHLIISNLLFWDKLRSIGFKEYADNVRTIAAMTYSFTMINGGEQELLLFSITPSMHKEYKSVFILSNGIKDIIVKVNDLSYTIVIEMLYQSASSMHKLLKDFNAKANQEEGYIRVSTKSIKVISSLKSSLKKLLKENHEKLHQGFRRDQLLYE